MTADVHSVLLVSKDSKIISTITTMLMAPVFEVTTPIALGKTGIGFLYFSSNNPSAPNFSLSFSYINFLPIFSFQILESCVLQVL